MIYMIAGSHQLCVFFFLPICILRVVSKLSWTGLFFKVSVPDQTQMLNRFGSINEETYILNQIGLNVGLPPPPCYWESYINPVWWSEEISEHYTWNIDYLVQ